MKRFAMKSLFVNRCLALLVVCAALLFSWGDVAQAYPYYAQMNYDSPREATGKIVCANCHLAAMPTRVEVPQAVTPGKVFDITVELPYDLSSQQVIGDGSKAGLNVGAVVMLPEGFRLATEEEMGPEKWEEISENYISTYSDEQPHILLVGPLPGESHQELIFPVKAPDPAEDPSVSFMKYKVFVGGNRGRGQLNPDGSMSNNNVFRSPVEGTVSGILAMEDPFSDLPAEFAGTDVGDGYPGTRLVSFDTAAGPKAMVIPPGPELLVAIGDSVSEGQNLTSNPNVGGFGQVERDLVLQSPDRIKWLVAFLGAVLFAQIMLVLKKKQIEQIQAAELLG